MNENEYISKRLDNQISYYDSQSVRNKKFYLFYSVIQVVCGSLIPFISGFSDGSTCFNVSLGVLGVLIAVSTALLSLCKSQEKWITYRTTCENLRHLKFKFLTKTDPFNKKASLGLLVSHVEALISKENSDWSNIALTNLENKKK